MASLCKQLIYSLGLIIISGTLIAGTTTTDSGNTTTQQASATQSAVETGETTAEQTLSPEEAKKQAALEKRAYTLTYTGNRKGPELGNAKIKGQLFQNSRPVSFFETETNEDGQFAFDKDYGKNTSISLHYIEGQRKMRMSCEGLATPGTKEIKVKCYRN